MSRPALRLRWVLFLLLVHATAAPATEGGIGPGLALELDPAEPSPGQPATLRVLLIDEEGAERIADRDVEIGMAGGEGIVADRLRIPAGQASAEATFKAADPGAWRLEASAEGLLPAERWILVPKPLPLRNRRQFDFGTPGIAPPPGPPPGPPPLIVRVPPSLTGDELDRIVESLGDLRFDDRRDTWSFDSESLRARDALLKATGDGGLRRGDRSLWIRGAGLDEARSYFIAGLPEFRSTLMAHTDEGFGELRTIEAGELRLLAQPERPRGPMGGEWDPVTLLAVWFGKDGDRWVPTVRSSTLVFDLDLLDFERTPRMVPANRLTIAEGGSSVSAQLISDRAQTVKVRARWSSGLTEQPLEVTFLPSPPRRLVFHKLPSKVRGIGPLRRTIRVGLADDVDRLVTSGEVTELIVDSSIELLADQKRVSIPAGHRVVSVNLELGEPGRYRLTATATNAPLEDAAGEIEYLFAWSLAVWALVGGLIGAVAAAVYLRDRKWWRILLLGVVAALVAVLLASFGILSVLEGVLPGAAALQEKVTVGTTLGMLCIAILAGLAGELVIGFLVRGAPVFPTGSPQTDPKPTKPTKRKRRSVSDSTNKRGSRSTRATRSDP